MRTITISCMLLLASLSLAQAKDQAIRTHLGWEHTASSAYEDGITSSVAYEHRLYKNLFLGLEYTYHGDMEHHTGEDDNPYSYGDMSGESVLLDAIYYPSKLRYRALQPYLIGGVGYSWWDFEESDDVVAKGITVSLGDALAYKVGIGTLYSLNDSIDLFIEWSFFKASVPKDAYYADGSYSSILGDDRASGRVKIGEEETRLTFGVRYSW